MLKALAITTTLTSVLTLSGCPAEPTDVPGSNGSSKGGQTITLGVDINGSGGYNWRIIKDGKAAGTGSSSGSYQTTVTNVKWGVSIKAENHSNNATITCFIKIGLTGSKENINSAKPGKSCYSEWVAPRS